MSEKTLMAPTHGTRRISADTSLRLSRYFRMSEGFWTGLQDTYDREVAKDQLRASLDRLADLAEG